MHRPAFGGATWALFNRSPQLGLRLSAHSLGRSLRAHALLRSGFGLPHFARNGFVWHPSVLSRAKPHNLMLISFFGGGEIFI